MILLEKVQEAGKLIEESIIRTPLVHSPTFSRLFGCEIFLKLENLQKTGSFKVRGATYKILISKEKIGPSGVVAASAGNHAQGVAIAATKAGLASTIIMPEWASITKQEATRSYGGRVEIYGQGVEESLERALALAEKGMMFIHPFDDPAIITGQGTVAMEIMEDLPETDIIIVPLGGGGLISGVSLVAKAMKPQVRIIGVESAACPSARVSMERKKRVRVTADPSIADGISVKKVGKTNFEYIRRYVDGITLVSEDEIASAILMLLERKKTLAEGAGAVSLAALMKGGLSIPKGSRVVLVISGGNLDSLLLDRIISRGLRKSGRIMRLSVNLEDAPGSMARLLTRVADLKANILRIHHDRSQINLPLFYACVELEIETRSASHIREIEGNLKRAGYAVWLMDESDPWRSPGGA